MSLRDTVSSVAGAVALAFCVLGVGGALRWVQAVEALLVVVALAPLLLSRRALNVSPLVAVLGIACLLTVLQLVPLPDSWLEALDPTNQGLRVAGSKLADIDASSTISLDPPGTLRAVGFFITLFGAATVALRFSTSERGRLICLGAVASICLVTTIVVAIHEVFDADTLYGIYTPTQAAPPILGPLLNANHLGGLCALGAAVSTGLFMYPKQSRAARATWAMTVLSCVVVVLASLSRGATLALFAGIGVTLGTFVAQRVARPVDRRARSLRRRFLMTSLPIGAMAICTMTGSVFPSANPSVSQLESTSVEEVHDPRSKYAAWKSATQLVEESPYVGIGRGAFEPAFTHVHPASSFLTFSHLENEYLQAVVDWGIPGAIALALAVGWVGVAAIRRWRDGPLASAALGGLTTVLVQSNVDFGVELLGLAIPVTVVAATLTYTPMQTMHRGFGLWRVRAFRGLHLVALGIVAIILHGPATRTIEEEHLDLDKRPSMFDVHASIARHPLDYYGYAIAAETLLHDHDTAAIPMLNHALVLHPSHTGLHRFAGRVLLAIGNSQQAAIEYQTALRGTADPRSLVFEIDHSFPADKAADAIPAEYDDFNLITQELVKDGHADIAQHYIARVVEHAPSSLVAIDALYELSMQNADYTEAEVAVRKRLHIIWSTHATVQLAQLLAKRKANDEVVSLLVDVEGWHGRIDDQAAAWLALCDAKLGLGDLDVATKRYRRLDGEGLPGVHEDIQRQLNEIARRRKDANLLEHYRAATPP